MNARPEPPTRTLAPTPTPTVADASTPPYSPASAWRRGPSTGANTSQENAAIGRAEIEAELVDLAIIVFPQTMHGREGATQFLARGDDEAKARGDLTTQGAKLDILVGRSGQRHSENERRSGGAEESLEIHLFVQSFGQISDATPARCANVQHR